MALQTPDIDRSDNPSELGELLQGKKLLQFFKAVKTFENFLLANGTQLTNGRTNQEHDLYTSTISISKEQLEQIPNTDEGSEGIYRNENEYIYLRTPLGEIIQLAPIPEHEFEIVSDNYPHGSENSWILESTLRIVAHYFPEFFNALKNHTANLFDNKNGRGETLLNTTQYQTAIDNIYLQQEARATPKRDTFIEHFRAFISILQSSLLTEEELQELDDENLLQQHTPPPKRTTVYNYIRNLPEDHDLRQKTINTIENIIEEYRNIQLGDVARNILTTLFSLINYLSNQKETPLQDRDSHDLNTPPEP